MASVGDPACAGGGDRLDDVGRAPRLRDADDERPLQPERAVVERHERRAGERDREPAGQAEGVLRVAGGVVGRAARGDQDEAQVLPREGARDAADVRPLADEEARQDVGLFADLGAKDGTVHRATSGASFSGKSHAAPRTPDESPQRGGRSGVSTRSEKTQRPQSRGTSLVEAGDVREAAAEDDHVGVEDVDDARERAGHPVLVARERGRRPGVARPGRGGDLVRAARPRPSPRGGRARGPARRGTSRCSRVLPHQQAGPGPLVLRGPRERVVAPLAGDRVRPGEDAAVHDDSAARAGPDDDAEDARGTGRRAVARLGEGEAVRVVGEADLAAEDARRGRSPSGRPRSQVEFAFFTRPVAGEIVPGIPTPTVPRAPSVASTSATRPAIVASVPS